MKVYHDSEKTFFQNMEFMARASTAKIIGLTKINCFNLHKHISMKYDGVCEDLTWDNDLVFNCETYTHEDLYNNLFKLRFKGVQLGQE